MIVFEQKWMNSFKMAFSNKIGCVREKVVAFGQSGYIRQSCCNPAKVVVFGQKGCTRAKWL